MEGKSTSFIAKYLTENGIPTPDGKKNWQFSTIESILTNEKYKGDARLQKKFTTDYLTKTMKVNEGEVPQYYVENSPLPSLTQERGIWFKVSCADGRNPHTETSRRVHSPVGSFAVIAERRTAPRLALQQPIPPCDMAMQP